MMYFGACYYPEHWTPKQAKDHIPLMKQAGINVVRMGEFAWSRFEPEQGRYRFEWMDAVIQALHKEGISTVLCTPTCIPPQWAVQKHPGMLQRDADGRVRNPGSRCHCCKNAPEYQMLADRIVDQMARHYADMPGVIGWQTDNEFGCHNTTRCYCDHCQSAFRDWLLEKYKDTDSINQAWGTAFWGFEFQQWNEIPLPRRMPAGNNPSHWLDFARFSSDTQVKFQQAQYELLKQLCPKHFVTHNFMGGFPEIDYWKLAQFTDFPSWDNYPESGEDPFLPAYHHEITRSFTGRFWVMEQKSGPTGDANTGLMGEQPEPGDIRRWTWQAVANGADGVCYFRWRACLSGAEQYWHGILDHDGVARRRYREVAETGAELAKLGAALAGTAVQTPVAILRNYAMLWSAERQPGAPGFHYDAHCYEIYRAVKRTGHGCDFVDIGSDLGRYAVVFAPCACLADKALADRLDAFAQAGGTVVLTPQSGARTPTNTMWAYPRPGAFVAMAGLTVEEVRPYHHGQTETIEPAGGQSPVPAATVGKWVEVLACREAQPVAQYAGGALKGACAATRNVRGKGAVYYLGVYLPPTALEGFAAAVLPPFPVGALPPDVEVTRRTGKQGSFLFVINHSKQPQTVTLPKAFPELLTGGTLGPEVRLEGNKLLIFKV